MCGHPSALIEAMRRLSEDDCEGAAGLPPAPPEPVAQMFDAMHDAARAFAIESRHATLSGDSTAA